MTATAPSVDLSVNGVPQRRRLVTAVPGPRSLELLARREAAVARGVSVMLPTFVDTACHPELNKRNFPAVPLGKLIEMPVGHATVHELRETDDICAHLKTALKEVF